MYLVVGLGNYLPKYALTRHNIGFMVLDNLAEKYNAQFKLDSKFKAEIANLNINSKKIILVKPQTLMNLSGDSVILLKNFYKLENHQIFVIFDDLSINLGQFRIKKEGSFGGHNGIKSIMNMLNSKDIPRLKIGVGPQDKFKKSEIYVLENFPKYQQDILNKVVLFSQNIVEDYINLGLEKAQNLYNGVDLTKE